MTSKASPESLRQIRALLLKEHLDGFILPRGDEFLGEYVAPYAERLAWLTGFTGSAGLAILLQDAGAVFSDGRYTEQLRAQLDATVWSAQSISGDGPVTWLKAQGRRLKLGYDPQLTSSALLEMINTATNIISVPVTANPIDLSWHNQPARPEGPVLLLDAKYHGRDCLLKRKDVAERVRDANADALLITDPSALNWLLNLRGNDVPYTPITLGFALVYKNADVTAFIDPSRVPDLAASHVGHGVDFAAPETLPNVIATLRGQTVLLDPASATIWFRTELEAAGASVVYAPDPCQTLKAIKNATELDGARRIQQIDSAALCRFLHAVETSGADTPESELADRLGTFRAQSPEYREESFPTISASGANAALPHYRAIAGQDRILSRNEIYLVDSGGQYYAGTTDVTRTIWVGPDTPPHDICDAFTRVLKGHIALATAVFPAGTPGYRLDPLARYALWQAGLDYDHGTGHGVGSYLSVHEGPQNIGAAPRPVPLQPGMIVSNEPGYYAPGRYGIRCENLIVVREAPQSSGRAFYAFETLNYAPFDQKLILLELLTVQERDWLDAYHAQVCHRIAPLLEGEARSWLINACSPINKKRKASNDTENS